VLFNWSAQALPIYCGSSRYAGLLDNELHLVALIMSCLSLWLLDLLTAKYVCPVTNIEQYGFWIDGNPMIILVWRRVWQTNFLPWKEFDMDMLLREGDSPSWQNVASRTDIGLGMFSSIWMFFLSEDRIGGVSWKKNNSFINHYLVIKDGNMQCNNQLQVFTVELVVPHDSTLKLYYFGCMLCWH
jgi:hypothetical protein